MDLKIVPPEALLEEEEAEPDWSPFEGEDMMLDEEEQRQLNYVGIYITANIRNQLFPWIPNPFRESGESLKCIEIPRNLWNLWA